MRGYLSIIFFLGKRENTSYPKTLTFSVYLLRRKNINLCKVLYKGLLNLVVFDFE